MRACAARPLRHCNKKFGALLIVVLFTAGAVIYGSFSSAFSYPKLADPGELRDWHDHAAIARDKLRRHAGLGEFGEAAVLGGSFENASQLSRSQTGFNVLLSERISLERALPDARHSNCLTKTYYAQLPPTSVIIVHHNEQRSVILRSLHSIINRTPAELLHEIILVNDYSTDHLHLDAYVHDRFAGKVKLLHLPTRVGLMRARVLGSRQAGAAVLVFLDAHVEVTHNWLPPLLAPIVDNPNTCTTPIIDTIKYDSFEYVPTAAARGGFNWQFNYVQLPLLAAEKLALPEPHNNPVMNGGLFAIRSEFFWHLGAYDERLRIWGAEQFELSFKIWMCGGRLLEVPCSRVGHLYRDPSFQLSYTNRTDDFISKNYKRVAEVWLDEYKDLLYEHIPKLTQIRAGDLSAQRALRRRLECKTFKWYLETIAPDLQTVYPAVEPPDFASGAIQSVSSPQLCLDSDNRPERHIITALKLCSPDLKHPYAAQRWHLSFRRTLQQHDACLEVQTSEQNAPLWLWPCHNQGGNQFWYYDRPTQMLVQGSGQDGTDRRCLEANLSEQRVYVNICDFTNKNMRWRFGYVNDTAMKASFKGLPANSLEYVQFYTL